MAKFESNLNNVLSALNLAKRQTTEAIGLYVEGEAKARCPVDTGNLRGSISHDSDEEKAVIGSSTEYGIFVEKGTSRQKAQPYLTPAVENNISTIKEIVQRGLGRLGST